MPQLSHCPMRISLRAPLLRLTAAAMCFGTIAAMGVGAQAKPSCRAPRSSPRSCHLSRTGWPLLADLRGDQGSAPRRRRVRYARTSAAGLCLGGAVHDARQSEPERLRTVLRNGQGSLSIRSAPIRRAPLNPRIPRGRASPYKSGTSGRQVSQRGDQLAIRLGSDQNRRDWMMLDGPFVEVIIRERTVDGFRGTWNASLGYTNYHSIGYFCAVREP